MSMARTCKYLGAVAEHRFYRDISWLSYATFPGWTCVALRPWRANAVRSLAVSFEGLSFSPTAAVSGTLFRLRGALSALPDLRELIVSGLSDARGSVQDIPGGSPSALRLLCDVPCRHLGSAGLVRRADRSGRHYRIVQLSAPPAPSSSSRDETGPLIHLTRGNGVPLVSHQLALGSRPTDSALCNHHDSLSDLV
ncbi:hypothetical protein C8Q79DRAFT_430385 [Trametes meyenii]|nr:hypothetical protein C8Q79DRAFT_430385 [Trametes meyenii]